MTFGLGSIILSLGLVIGDWRVTGSRSLSIKRSKVHVQSKVAESAKEKQKQQSYQIQFIKYNLWNIIDKIYKEHERSPLGFVLLIANMSTWKHLFLDWIFRLNAMILVATIGTFSSQSEYWDVVFKVTRLAVTHLKLRTKLMSHIQHAESPLKAQIIFCIFI